MRTLFTRLIEKSRTLARVWIIGALGLGALVASLAALVTVASPQ